MLLKYYNPMINFNEYFLDLALTFSKMKITLHISFFLVIKVIKLIVDTSSKTKQKNIKINPLSHLLKMPIIKLLKTFLQIFKNFCMHHFFFLHGVYFSYMEFITYFFFSTSYVMHTLLLSKYTDFHCHPNGPFH